MTETSFARSLEWDSEFFSLRIATVKVARIDLEIMKSVCGWCAENRIECLYYLADPSDTDSIRLAEAHGFNLVDIRITLEMAIISSPRDWVSESPVIRLSRKDDIPPLRTMAAENHRDSRFYRDGRFPVDRCDELYATWIEKSCSGYADAVLVADKGDGAVGYTSCHLKSDGTGNIGLVGVNSRCQGKGFGQLLISEALSWFSAQGVSRVTVVTQGINTGAQRLYQKNGFITKAVEPWYHLWLNQHKHN